MNLRNSGYRPSCKTMNLWSPGWNRSGRETNNHRAIVVAGQNKCFLAAYPDAADMPHLAFDGKPVDRLRGERAVPAVYENGAEVGVISSHLDRVLIIVPHQQDIRQAVVIGIDDDGIPVGR